eukprot:c276_g1_i1.p1 GENE.c276_g1_i1~~c276_g1_i1.p1  ORF type:complete len:532 (+),score=145.95 c276_g1_i1:298-1893(+)
MDGVLCSPEMIGTLDTWRSSACSSFQRCIPSFGRLGANNTQHECSCGFADTLFASSSTDATKCVSTTLSNLQVGFWAIGALISLCIFVRISRVLVRARRAGVLHEFGRSDFLAWFAYLVAVSSFVSVFRCAVRSLRVSPAWSSKHYSMIDNAALASDALSLVLWSMSTMTFAMTCLGVLSRTKKLNHAELQRYESFLKTLMVCTLAATLVVLIPFWYFQLRVTIDLAIAACCCGLLGIELLVRYRLERAIASIENMKPALRNVFNHIHQTNNNLLASTVLQLCAAVVYVGLWFAARTVKGTTFHQADYQTSYGLAICAKIIFVSLLMLQVSLVEMVASKVLQRIKDHTGPGGDVETLGVDAQRNGRRQQNSNSTQSSNNDDIHNNLKNKKAAASTDSVILTDTSGSRHAISEIDRSCLPILAQTDLTISQTQIPPYSHTTTAPTELAHSPRLSDSRKVVVSSPGHAAVMVIPGSTRGSKGSLELRGIGLTAQLPGTRTSAGETGDQNTKPETDRNVDDDTANTSLDATSSK